MTAPQQRYVHTGLIVAGTGTLSITAICQDSAQYARSWIFARRARTCFKKHLLAVISYIPDRQSTRDEHTLHPHDQQGQRRTTRMTSGQSNQSSA